MGLGASQEQELYGSYGLREVSALAAGGMEVLWREKVEVERSSAAAAEVHNAASQEEVIGRKEGMAHMVETRRGCDIVEEDTVVVAGSSSCDRVA